MAEQEQPWQTDDQSLLLGELRRYRFLAQLDDAIRLLVDPQEITHTAATLLGQYLQADRCAYAHVNDDQSFTLTGNFTNGIPSIVGHYDSASFGSEFVRLSRLGLPYIVEDTETDSRVSDVLQAYRQVQIRAVISIPIIKNSKFVAGMAVHQSTPRQWQEDDIKLVTAVANRCWESIERNRIAVELRRAEERIRSSHDYLRLLINCTEEGFYSVDQDGVTIMCNTAFLKMLGFEREGDVVGQKLHAVIHHSHPDGSHYPVESCPIYHAAQHGKPAYVPDEMFFRADGSSFPVEYRVQPVWQDGQLHGAVCTFVDLTERKHTETALRQSQAHLQALFEQTAAGIVEVDLTGQMLRANDRYCKIVGRSREDLLTKRMQDITHPDDLVRNIPLFKNLVATGEPFEIEKRYIRPDGSVVWVNNTVSMIRTGGEKPVQSVLAVTVDISERKLAEEALHQADRRKDEFLAMLAHELRNPLAPVKAAAELLKVGGLDERRTNLASEIISRQVGHMSNLIDDLLDVSRVTRGLVELKQESIDLKMVINSAIEQARPLIESRKHEVRTRIASAVAYVKGDRTRLIQIFVNLLANAAKYTPQGGEIEVTLRVHPTTAEISVQDNGIGIEPRLLPHIFKLFTQGERTPDRTQGGLGLGLALVQSLTHLHHGQVSALSDGLGRGSVFTVVMPLLEDVQVKQDDLDLEQVLPLTVNPVSLMIVDDNLDAANSLAALLQAGGHHVMVCEDAKSALEVASQSVPQVFILDIGLPEMDGYELARRLRASPDTAKTTLIALTGYGQEHDRLRSEAAGFDHHFVKPIDTIALANILFRMS